MVQSILLYYCYVDLRACREAVHSWLSKLCEELQLKGRVRVAFDGINVTVCGASSCYVLLRMDSRDAAAILETLASMALEAYCKCQG